MFRVARNWTGQSLTADRSIKRSGTLSRLPASRLRRCPAPVENPVVSKRHRYTDDEYLSAHQRLVKRGDLVILCKNVVILVANKNPRSL